MDRWLFVSDGPRIQQILANFCWNAVKFTDAGSVTLRVLANVSGKSKRFGTLRFEVADTGVGMDADLQERLFVLRRPTQTGVFSRQGDHGGSGLGLNICKALAAKVGGKVGCNSTKGEGSVFWLEATVPVLPMPETEETADSIRRSCDVARYSSSPFTAGKRRSSTSGPGQNISGMLTSQGLQSYNTHSLQRMVEMGGLVNAPMKRTSPTWAQSSQHAQPHLVATPAAAADATGKAGFANLIAKRLSASNGSVLVVAPTDLAFAHRILSEQIAQQEGKPLPPLEEGAPAPVPKYKMTVANVMETASEVAVLVSIELPSGAVLQAWGGVARTRHLCAWESMNQATGIGLFMVAEAFLGAKSPVGSLPLPPPMLPAEGSASRVSAGHVKTLTSVVEEEAEPRRPGSGDSDTGPTWADGDAGPSGGAAAAAKLAASAKPEAAAKPVAAARPLSAAEAAMIAMQAGTKQVTGALRTEAVAAVEGKPQLSLAPAEPAAGGAPKLRYLVVDDEPVNTKLLERRLLKMGQSVATAADGTEAVEMIVAQGRRFDVILLDECAFSPARIFPAGAAGTPSGSAGVKGWLVGSQPGGRGRGGGLPQLSRS